MLPVTVSRQDNWGQVRGNVLACGLWKVIGNQSVLASLHLRRARNDQITHEWDFDRISTDKRVCFGYTVKSGNLLCDPDNSLCSLTTEGDMNSLMKQTREPPVKRVDLLQREWQKPSEWIEARLTVPVVSSWRPIDWRLTLITGFVLLETTDSIWTLKND